MDRTGDRATVRRTPVRRTPCWLARRLVARETVVELERRSPYWWNTVDTGRVLSELDHGALIGNALDFVPVVELPRVIARHT